MNMKNPTVCEQSIKSALAKKLSAEYADVERPLVYQAVNEADALASLTTVPWLVLPTLAEEKVQNIAAWSRRQRSLWPAAFASLGKSQFTLAGC
jgi:hypothetical protein